MNSLKIELHFAGVQEITGRNFPNILTTNRIKSPAKNFVKKYSDFSSD